MENDGGENDGGESDGGENDGGESDGEAEDGSDAGASVDAEAAAELDATTALLGTITGWACAYCRCRSPEETCAILQAAGQDGGP